MSGNFPSKHHNFTVRYNGITRVIVSNCFVGRPILGKNPTDDYQATEFMAIWDTGATGSVITKKAVEHLGLIPVSKMFVQGVNSRQEKNVYSISLGLPNNVTMKYINVTECDDLAGEFDVLIGMDIISLGDFAITNSGGETYFSFRFPSIARIDFAKSDNNKNISLDPPKRDFKSQVRAMSNNQSKRKKKR